MGKHGQSCETPTNATWKRIQRPQKSKTNPSHQNLCGTKRAQFGVTGCDEEKIQNAKRNKKKWKERMKTPTTQWWRLLGSSAENNEAHELELPGGLGTNV